MSRELFSGFAKLSLLLGMILILTACTSASPTPVTQAVELTQTPVPTPSQEPTPASLPTFSLATVDSTLTTLPTFDFSTTVVSTPFQTATLTVPALGPGTPETECFVTASKEGIQLKLGPSFSAYKLLPKMEPGIVYQAIDIHERFYQLAMDGIPVGWVQYLDVFPTEGLSTEGPGCDRLFARLPDTRPLTDFPGLCLFTVTGPTETFRDSALIEPFFISLSPSSGYFVGLTKTRKSIFTLLSHAGPSFHVPLDKVSTSAACAGIPTSATVTTAGWLWSKPDERQGEKLMQLTIGMRLHIEGKRPPDSSGEAAWVQAVVEEQNASISGWVWSALVSFD